MSEYFLLLQPLTNACIYPKTINDRRYEAPCTLMHQAQHTAGIQGTKHIQLGPVQEAGVLAPATYATSLVHQVGCSIHSCACRAGPYLKMGASLK